MKKSVVITLGLILISFLIGVYLYPQMPEKMASHWNSRGEVDDYMPRFWALFLMPMFSIGLFLLFLLVPKIDPLKQNIEKFRKYYDGFIVLIIGFLLYVYILTIFWNLGFRFNMVQLMMPALGALFYYCGVLMENAKRNWFIGIKTPWTLSSEIVWNKTHKLGGRLFKIAGIIALLGIILEDYAFIFIIVPVIFISVYLIAYSYFEYQKELKS
ncbi:SdpI family protein [Candidatus Parcubacteria bacterium]|nr:SdpI family protein [Candidatus Parcubacteria bacterium]